MPRSWCQLPPASSGRYQELARLLATTAGKGDKIVKIEPQPMRLHGLVRQSTLEVIDGTGHMLHHTFPEKVSAAIEILRVKMKPEAGRVPKAAE